MVEQFPLNPQEINSKESSKATNSICIEGVIEKITFHNIENGFSVIKIRIKNQTEIVTVVGYSGSMAEGESINAIGNWTKDKNYGDQFVANFIQITPPNNVEEIEKYLASGAIKGIGEHLANKLVNLFGVDIFDVIENSPQKLLEIESIGPNRLKLIKDSWKEKRHVQKIMVFLQSHGVTPAKAIKIYNKYGEGAIDLAKTNPYQLIKDIPGIGFKTADQIALQVGVDQQSHLRARAGINYILSEKYNQGHCAYPRSKLVNDTAYLLNLDIDVINRELEQELNEGFLVSDVIENYECIYESSMYRLEKSVSNLIVNLKEGSPSWPFPKNIEKSFVKIEKQMKLTLAPLQKLAIHTALINKISVITGGPGTGKSTLTRVLTTYLRNNDIRITLCSPTGRAAKRLFECTGIEAKTIHRLLFFDRETSEFKYNEFNKLQTDFILIDESSMIDIFLAHALLKAIPEHAVIVFVGDVDQLPSVGPGQFLKDLICSELVPVITLTQIFRQSKESQIIQVAHQINHGKLPDLTHHRNSDFFFIEKNSPEEVEETILDLVSHRLPAAFGFDSKNDIQVLSPMQKGKVGVKNLNLKLQKLLNKNPINQIEKYGFYFGVGDKVIITENNYDKDVFNGDIGFIDQICIEEQVVKILIDNRLVEYNFLEMESIQPSYAITIHKSQGSEYPAVIMPIVTEHSIMMQRNLIYTGISRGKKLVVMVGQTRALQMALSDFKMSKRWTKLKEWLKNNE